MKVLFVLALVILSHQKISLANYLRIDNSGKSSLSTEYQARFQQRHCDGVNVSEGNIAGNHRFEKSTNEEPWESFASKCASIIHGLVSALTSAVAPVPGDAMNMELDIKNQIFHHDDRQFNACKPAGALPDTGNAPSTALAPSGFPVRGRARPYPSRGGFLPPATNYLDAGAVTLAPGIVYGDDVQQLPLSQLPEGSGAGYLPGEACPTPEPTMNTPATHEASCETTTPNFSPVPDFQIPSYPAASDGGLAGFDRRNKLVDGGRSFPADVLPLDNWKPCPNHKTDLISPGTALTDDCSSTSPHLAPGFVTPASFPSRNLSPNNLAWDQFYKEHPELLSPNSSPKSRSCSPTENSPWSPGFDWDAYPSREPDYPPHSPPLNDGPFDPVPGDGLVTPVSPVTDCPPEEIGQGQQLPYQPPAEGVNTLPAFVPGDNLSRPNASGSDFLPEETYPNQGPGFVPPFQGADDLPNPVPGGNCRGSLGSGDGFPLKGPFSNERPSYFTVIEDRSSIPGGFGAPFPDAPCPPQDTYPDQRGYLPPGSNFGDGALGGQNLYGPAGAPESAPLQNSFPQPPEYPPPLPLLPPPSFNDPSPGVIPSDSLVTQIPPVPGYPFDNGRQNEQPGRLPPQPFNGEPSDAVPSQTLDGPLESAPLVSNWGSYPSEQPGQLPLQSVNGDSPNPAPGQNPGGPMGSALPGSENWGPYPTQEPGQLPPQPMNGDSPLALPGQNLGGPLEPDTPGSGNWGSLANQQPGGLPQPINGDSFNTIPEQNLGGPMGSGPFGPDNWGPYPNEQAGQLPPQSLDCDSSSDLPGPNPGGPTESGPPGSDNWSPYPNQEPGQLPPQSFNDGFPNNLPGQNLEDTAADNWGPFPGQDPGQPPLQPFDDGLSNNLPDQGPADPAQSDPLASNNWGPYPNEQPGQLPPQSFNGNLANDIPGQNPGGPMGSGPFGPDNWGPYPNEQPGQLPPQSLDCDSSSDLPGPNPGGPTESGPPGSDNWSPYPNQHPGDVPRPEFDRETPRHYPGDDFQRAPPEPDNSLEGPNWDGSPQNLQDYLYGMNGPSKFIPGNGFGNPIPAAMPDSGASPGNDQPSPLPPGPEGFNDAPLESTPSDQQIPHDVVTEPTFEGPTTPECSDNGPVGSDSGYDRDYPFWGKDQSGGGYPAGNPNADAEQPVPLPGTFQAHAPESADQVSQPCPEGVGETGKPGFLAQEPECPGESDLVAESTRPVPDYVTPAYDDLPQDFNPEMEYQGQEDYGPGPDGALRGPPPRPVQGPPRYGSGFPPAKPNYYGVPNPNRGWSPNGLYRQPQYGPASTGVDPSAIYIPMDPEQGVLLTDPSQDQDSDEFCSCDDCYYDDIVDQKAFRKTACRDLEEARDELKAIFDKIKKKLKCTQKNSKCFANV